MKARTLPDASAGIDRPHLGRLLIAFGTFVILLSYAAIGLHVRDPWPWHVVVHEDGRRSLLETVLFYQHALRELPLDLLLGLMVGGCALLAEPAGAAGRAGSSARRTVLVGSLLSMVIGVIVLGAFADIGLEGLSDELLQKATRPGAPLVTGAHWHYHLVSRLALLLVSFGFAGLLRQWSDRGSRARDRAGLTVVAGTLLIFLLLTIAFTSDPAALRAPFIEPRHLGHQAREAVTHGLITLPLGFGVCLLVLGRAHRAGLGPSAGRGGGGGRAGWIAGALAAGGLGLALGAWLGFAALAFDAASHGQTSDLVTLIFPHVFEHTFTYLVVTLVALLVCVSFDRPASNPR